MARPRYQQGSIRCIGKNCWKIRWREDVRSEGGTLQRIYRAQTLRRVNKAQAREVLEAHLSKMNCRRLFPGINIPLARFVAVEWRPNAALRLRNSTMRMYSFNLEKYVLPMFGQVPLQEVNRSHIESCLSRLRQKGHAVSTLRNVRSAISGVLDSAVDRQFITYNSAHRIRLREAGSKTERRYYRAPDIRLLLSKLDEPCRSVVLIAVSTGLRIGEILALRWKRVDLLRGTLEVAETYSSGEFGPPKTRSSRRTIPISSSLLESFKALRPANCDAESLVFATSRGTPLDPHNLYSRVLAPACDSLERPRVSWHSFRHTHATLLHDIGESLKTAQSLLGHSDMQTTLAVYTHAIPDSQRRAVERVAEVLNPVGPNLCPRATSQRFVN
jgi:integrase